MLRTGSPLRAVVSTLVSVVLAGCGAVNTVKSTVLGGGPALGTTGISGAPGGVAADEPRAVLVGKQILAQGGSAADAAAAVGFTLAVTLPSRAGLGAGGACLAYSPEAVRGSGSAPEAIVFTSRPPAAAGGDRPAAAPMLAQGMFALHARFGVLPVEQIIAPAEQLAELGIPVSRAFGQDLALVGPALIADPGAAQVFGARGAALAEGDPLTQIDLGATLAALRVRGVNDLLRGTLARTLVAQSSQAGGRLSAADLQAALPRLAAPLVLAAGKDKVAFLPPPADGGLAAAAAFQRLQAAPDDMEAAQARAMGAVTAWRHGGADAPAILAASETPAGAIGALPASTSFVTLDRTGGAVACAVSMGNLFGTGRVAPGTGMLLAASPAVLPPPLLAAAIAWNDSQHAFRAAVAGSGQAGAGLGVAAGMAAALKSKAAMPSTVPEPGRINAIGCARYLPGNAEQCSWATDPRNAGLAASSD